MPLGVQNNFSRHPFPQNGVSGKIPRKLQAIARKGKGP